MNEFINSCVTMINDIGRGFCNFAGSMFIQSTVLILLLLIIDFLIRKRVRATFRYWIWMLVFIKLVLPPTLSSPTGIGNLFGKYFSVDSIITAQPTKPVQYEPAAAGAIQEFTEPATVPQIQPIPALSEPVTPAELNPPITSATPAISAAPGLSTLNWQGIAFLFWLVGVLVITVLLIQRIFFVKGLIAQSKPAKNRLVDILDNCREQVGVHGNIRLRLSHNVTSPAVCGLFHPVILIPGTLLEQLSWEKLRAVLIHELAHIKRGDLWINCVQTFLQIAYFYNPFVWIAYVIVRRIREQAVDEMVLVALGDQAKSYSNTLIDIAEMTFSRPALSLRLVGVVESKKALSQRIKHILYHPLPKSAKLGILGLIVIITTAVILLPMAKANNKSVQELVSKATVYMNPGEYQAARESLLSALQEKPDFAEAWVAYGMASSKLKDYKQTKTAYEKALKIYSDKYLNNPDANCLIQQVHILSLLNKDSEAEKLIDDGKLKYMQDDQFRLIAEKGLSSLKKDWHEFCLPENTTAKKTFQAALPNGVTVELVGLCREPVDNAQWWKPDGGEMSEPSFEANKISSPMEAVSTRYTFLAKAQGGENVSMQMKIYEGFGWSTKVARDGTALCYIKHPDDSQPHHKDAFEKGPIEIGVAQGQWIKGRGTSSPNMQIHRSYLVGSGDQIVIQPPQAEKSSPDMATIFWATTSSKDYQYRLSCTLKDGSVAECMEPFFQSTGIIETGGLSNGKLHTISFNIDKPLDQIVNYELLYRQFEYARFNNVAFKSDLKTNVQIETKFEYSRSRIEPLPPDKIGEMFERLNREFFEGSVNHQEIDLNLIYQSLIGPQKTLRAFAARYLGTHGNINSVPYLIDALSDESVHVGIDYVDRGMNTTRYWANDSLKKLTGEDLGFIWDDPKEKRDEIIQKWQKWWEQNKYRTNEKYKAESPTEQNAHGVHTIYLPDLETPDVNVVLDFATGRMLSAKPMEKDGQYFEKLGKGDLVYEYAGNRSGLLCLRGARMELLTERGLSSLKPDVERRNFVVYFVNDVPCQYRITTAEDKKYDLKILGVNKGDNGGVNIECRQADVRIEVEGDEIQAEEENLQAKKIFLPDVDDKGLMLDLDSGDLVDVPKADTPEKIAQALDKLKKGDIVFDTSSLILVRGATSPSLSGDVDEPFKTYKIGQNLPEVLNVRTKNGIEYTIEIHSIDKDGCQLEYYPVHPKHYVSASPLTTLEKTLVKQLLDMVRQVEEKYPEKATHAPEGPGIYHVDSKGKVTVWYYQKLGHSSEDCAEDEVGWGSSESVKATGMYYLPDSTPLQSRWRERGGGMKDIRVNVGHTLEEGERVGLIHRHDLSSERDLLSRDGLERKIMLYSYEDEPIMIVVRIDRPLTRGSWYCGDVEFDVKYFDDYDQITFSAPPGKGRLMFVTVKMPEGMSFGQRSDTQLTTGQSSEGENVRFVRSTIAANAAGQEKTQIVLKANIFSVNAPKSLIADYLRDELGVNDTATDLTKTQATQFKKWITALPDTTMISSPKALVFDGEQANLNVTTQHEFIVDYEKTSDSPPQYKPKRQKFTTGVELELTPELAKNDSIVHLILKLNQTELEKVEEKKHESGNMIQLPVRTNTEMATQVAVPIGKYFLVPVAGMYSAEKGSKSDQPVKQTILLMKADCFF
jgi:beta-lactamase regulating signal transducer with metallopeptidase domain